MCVDESLRRAGAASGPTASSFSGRRHMSYGGLPLNARDWAHCLQLMSGPANAYTAPIMIPSPSSTLATPDEELAQLGSKGMAAAPAAGQAEWGCGDRLGRAYVEAPRPRALSDPGAADALSGRVAAAQPSCLGQAEGELAFEQLMFARQESMEGLADKCKAAAAPARAQAQAGPATPAHFERRSSDGSAVSDAEAAVVGQQHLAVLETLAGEPLCGWEAQLSADARAVVGRLQAAGRASDAAPLVSELQRLGYDAQLHTSCSFSGSGRSSPTGGAQQPQQQRRSVFTGYHVFILVEPPADAAAAGAEAMVVDPAFRSQFEIARPSTAYATLLGGVPAVFCGHRLSLRRLVKFVTGRASESFVSEGLDVPPWRKLNSMYGRWLLHDA